MFAPRQEPASFFPKEKKIMKRFTFLFVLCACLFGWSVTGNVFAQPITVGFEEFATDIGTNWSWNNTNGRLHSGYFPNNPNDPASPIYPGNFVWTLNVPTYYGTQTEVFFTSQDVEFTNYSGASQGMNFWNGTGLSTVTDTNYASFSNEMASVTGKGNDNTDTYAVVYGDSLIDLPYTDSLLPRIVLPDGATIQSIAITNTVYAYDSMKYGDQFATPLEDFPDGYFDLIIYGVNSNGLVGSVTVTLGENTGVGTADILDYWKTVDLSSLAGAKELRFAFDGNDIGYGQWLNLPVYFAFDDLTYTIETEIEAEPEPEEYRDSGQTILPISLPPFPFLPVESL
jgi:hypothetical protein